MNVAWFHFWSWETGVREPQIVVHGAQPGLSALVDFVAIAKTGDIKDDIEEEEKL